MYIYIYIYTDPFLISNGNIIDPRGVVRGDNSSKEGRKKREREREKGINKEKGKGKRGSCSVIGQTS